MAVKKRKRKTKKEKKAIIPLSLKTNKKKRVLEPIHCHDQMSLVVMGRRVEAGEAKKSHFAMDYFYYEILT